MAQLSARESAAAGTATDMCIIYNFGGACYPQPNSAPVHFLFALARGINYNSMATVQLAVTGVSVLLLYMFYVQLDVARG